MSIYTGVPPCSPVLHSTSGSPLSYCCSYARETQLHAGPIMAAFLLDLIFYFYFFLFRAVCLVEAKSATGGTNAQTPSSAHPEQPSPIRPRGHVTVHGRGKGSFSSHVWGSLRATMKQQGNLETAHVGDGTECVGTRDFPQYRQ